jgi:hypothetical protein
MIVHDDGLSCFRLFSSEEIDVSPIGGSFSAGTFSDLMIYGKNHAYGILRSLQDTDETSLVEFELQHMITWNKVDKNAMFFRNGFNLKKDFVQMSICYLTEINTLMILNNPHEVGYR